MASVPSDSPVKSGSRPRSRPSAVENGAAARASQDGVHQRGAGTPVTSAASLASAATGAYLSREQIALVWPAVRLGAQQPGDDVPHVHPVEAARNERGQPAPIEVEQQPPHAGGFEVERADDRSGMHDDSVEAARRHLAHGLLSGRLRPIVGGVTCVERSRRRFDDGGGGAVLHEPWIDEQ